ncbi:methyltransferase domain-containing protein [Candidatus Saccharibacteria bacterium oral taxon 488]|nr:methyltransferase domain-containing protein [Candidatus Saccharibacteria bacterium oral taxon 488]
MYITLLGRQPEISLAELAAVFGADCVNRISQQFAEVQTSQFDITTLGGTIKYAEVITELPASRTDKTSLLAASRFITQHYQAKWAHSPHKITLGLSAYNLAVAARDIQKTGLILKSSLKKSGTSLRLIPNDQPALSTATAHNNKLGGSPHKVELLLVKTTDRRLIIAESRGVQNITAYTRRDRHRPKRDAFVGMLPPKLAQIMLNLALGAGPLARHRSCGNSVMSRIPAISSKSNASGNAVRRTIDLSERLESDPLTEVGRRHPLILDPFCGTGTVLQEALLAGYDVVGTDLSQKMVDYTTENLSWLQSTFTAPGNVIDIHQADATTHRWPNSTHLAAVVCETYLGQPFSAPPAPQKLAEVVGNCNHIITSFLTNIRSQLAPNTPLCIAVPAWYDAFGRAAHLPLIKNLQQLGYHQLNRTPLIYRRPDQVVARELLILQAT